MSEKYIYAPTPAAIVESRSCSQVPAFIPFTPLPKGAVGRKFAIVEILSEPAATQDNLFSDTEEAIDE